MSETDFDFDAASDAFDEARADDEQQPGPPGDEPGDDAGDDEGEAQSAEANPHGHMGYQEWIDAGKDPDDYVGKKAYQKQHERIVDNRQLQKDLKGVKKTQQQTLEAVSDWQKQEQKRMRAELEAELRTAKENEDVDGALDAQAALDEHDQKARATPPSAEAPEEMEPIANFRAENPLIDQSSDDYNPEFNAEVEIAFNALARRAYEQKREVTEPMINRWLRKAYKEASELFDDIDPPARQKRQPAESPRNNRQGQQGSKRRAQSKQPEARAEDYKLENPRNPRQGNAASEIRDLIADKYGADDAKAFEKSLTR